MIKNNLIEYLANIKLKKNIENIDFNIFKDYDDLHLFDNVHFISSEILHFIHNKLEYFYKFSNDKFDIKIYAPNSDQKYINLVAKIFSIIYYVIDVTKTNEFIKIYIFLTPIKKKFNKNNDFNSDAFNTGFTDSSVICIYREEEVLKVLIHELIHYLNLDNHFNDTNNKKLLNYFNMCDDCKINSNEAYTEMIAIIIFLVWYNKYNFNKFDYNKFNEIFNEELNYSLYQTAKCLSLIGCVNEFSDIVDKSNNCEIIQKTSFVSYFIIKTAFMFNIYLFFEFFKINENKFTLNFNLIPNNIIKYFNLIIKCIDDKKFIKIINYYIKLNKNKILNKNNRFTKYG